MQRCKGVVPSSDNILALALKVSSSCTVGLGLGTCLMQGCPTLKPGTQLSSLLDEVAGTVGIALSHSSSEGHHLLGLRGQYPEPCGEQCLEWGVRLVGRAGSW